MSLCILIKSAEAADKAKFRPCALLKACALSVQMNCPDYAVFSALCGNCGRTYFLVKLFVRDVQKYLLFTLLSLKSGRWCKLWCNAAKHRNKILWKLPQKDGRTLSANGFLHHGYSAAKGGFGFVIEPLLYAYGFAWGYLPEHGSHLKLHKQFALADCGELKIRYALNTLVL